MAKVKREKDGRWAQGQSGNPAGRKPGITEKDLLREAIKKVQEQKKKDLLEHFVERAYLDDRVLISLIDRLIPRLSTQVLTGAGGGPLRGLFDVTPELRDFVNAIVERRSLK